MTGIREQRVQPEPGVPRLREARLALGAQAAVALLCLSIPVFAAVQESFWVREAVSATSADPAVDLGGTDVRLWVCFVVFSLLLWTATALSSYKPWGKTGWSQPLPRAR